jgi:nucleoside-diphosphate-sugar epimerase
MTRILITGASGYLGRQLVQRCAALSGLDVHAVWHAHPERLIPHPPRHVSYHCCDIADPGDVSRLFDERRIDCVIHAAALLDDGGPDYLSRAARANVAGTARLAECAAAAGTRRFVYCSSISVYGAARQADTGWTEDGGAVPTSVYGWSKFAGEECVGFACAASTMTAVSLRLAGIHGGDRTAGALYGFTTAALAGRPLTVNNAAAPFQLLFVEDAVESLLRAAEVSDVARTLRVNVASHVFPSMRAFAEGVVETAASHSSILEGGGDDRRGDVMDTTRMREVLGYVPVPVEQRLRDYCRTLRAAVS